MAKNLFDHLKGVTKDKIKWGALSDEDKSSWSNFLINRWFSMDVDLVEAINEFQKYSNGILQPSEYYKLLHDCLPKTSYYLKYTKKKTKLEVDNKFIDLFSKHYQVNKRTVYDYIRMLKSMGSDELIQVLVDYGSTPEDIALFKKQLNTIK